MAYLPTAIIIDVNQGLLSGCWCACQERMQCFETFVSLPRSYCSLDGKKKQTKIASLQKGMSVDPLWFLVWRIVIKGQAKPLMKHGCNWGGGSSWIHTWCLKGRKRLWLGGHSSSASWFPSCNLTSLQDYLSIVTHVLIIACLDYCSVLYIAVVLALKTPQQQ